LARLITGAVMLRGEVFSRANASAGILAAVAGLGFYLPALGICLSILPVLLIPVWYLRIAGRLLIYR
jgi:hypothetical protein